MLFRKIRGDKPIFWYAIPALKYVEINTPSEIHEYLLLVIIIHELTHVLWFSRLDRIGYCSWDKYEEFNEGVTQKIAEEVMDQFLGKAEIWDKQSIFLMQIAKWHVGRLLEKDESKKVVKNIPSIKEIMAAKMGQREKSVVMAKELLRLPWIREIIQGIAQEEIDKLDIAYPPWVPAIERVIYIFAMHSGKPESEIWWIIKRWYFEGIDIIELCTHPQYWIQYDKWALMKMLL